MTNSTDTFLRNDARSVALRQLNEDAERFQRLAVAAERRGDQATANRRRALAREARAEARSL